MNTSRQAASRDQQSSAERRRIQNRDAQRRFRNKKSVANASGSSRATTNDDVVIIRGPPLAPRPLPNPTTASPVTSALQQDGSSTPSSRRNSELPKTMTSLSGNGYNGGIASPSEADVRLSRLFDPFMSYFGDLTDFGDNSVSMSSQSDIGMIDMSIFPTSSSLPDVMQFDTPSFPHEPSTSAPALLETNNTALRLTRSPSSRRRQKTSYPTPSSPGSNKLSSSNSSTTGALCINDSTPKPPQPTVAPQDDTVAGLLLEAGIEPSEYDTNSSDGGSEERNEPFQTSLHIAAKQGHEGMIDMVLQAGSIGVDEPDSDSNTALHVAVQRQKLQSVVSLLKHGADPNAENAAGWTPVHMSVSGGSVEIVEALVRCGGDLGKVARVRG